MIITYIQGYWSIFSQTHRHAQLVFWSTFPDSWEKCPDCFHQWVKFSLQNVVLRVSGIFSTVFFSGIYWHIQSYSALLRHIHTYWVIKAYSAPCVTFANGGLFKTLWNADQAYSEPCHWALFSHNQVYSEACAMLAYRNT